MTEMQFKDVVMLDVKAGGLPIESQTYVHGEVILAASAVDPSRTYTFEFVRPDGSMHAFYGCSPRIDGDRAIFDLTKCAMMETRPA